MNALDLANRKKDAERVAFDYFATLDKSKLKEKEYWDLFVKYANSVDYEVFTCAYDNRAEFCQLFGDKDVKRKIAGVGGLVLIVILSELAGRLHWMQKGLSVM